MCVSLRIKPRASCMLHKLYSTELNLQSSLANYICLFVYCICVCMQSIVQARRTEAILENRFLPSSPWGLGSWTQVVGLSSQRLYPLSHLATPVLLKFSFETSSHQVAQTAFELGIILSQPSKKLRSQIYGTRPSYDANFKTKLCYYRNLFCLTVLWGTTFNFANGYLTKRLTLSI